MEKNEIYEIEITDVSEEGSGIGHVDGMAVFVKDTVVGDRAEIRIVKVKKSYAFGRLEKLTSESEFRTQAVCPVARQCGGCTLQHITYEKELKLKQNRVMDCLQRIGGIDNPLQYLEGTHGMGVSIMDGQMVRESDEQPYRYRNKMQFPVGRNREGECVMGFYAGRTHSLIPVEDCYIGHPINKNLIKVITDWADKYDISIYNESTGTGLLRHVLTRVGFRTGELMVCLVLNGKRLPHDTELVTALKEEVSEEKAKEKKDGMLTDRIRRNDIRLTSVVINVNTDRTNKIMGERTKTIYGQDYITDYIGDVKYQISANSFYQVNPVQTERLYKKAVEYASLTGEETVWDMYCGIGTISLFMSASAKQVYGVEIVPQAIADAKINAVLNGIENVEFYTGAAEEVVSELYTQNKEEAHADVVVVDPPRKGCDAMLLKTISLMKPHTLVYVSCDPATLARDLKILLDEGFELKKISVYDQFSRSFHVETVVLLNNNFAKAKDFVQVGIDAEEYYRIKDSEKKTE